MMRTRSWVMVVGLLPACAGCGFFGMCEVFPTYSVSGTVSDADTSVPLDSVELTLQLLRLGEAIGDTATVQTDALGDFEGVIPFGIHSCAFPPDELLGDPPDEIQVTVRVGGSDIEVIVPIPAGAVSIESPGSGTIELSSFEVFLPTP